MNNESPTPPRSDHLNTFPPPLSQPKGCVLHSIRRGRDYRTTWTTRGDRGALSHLMDERGGGGFIEFGPTSNSLSGVSTPTPTPNPDPQSSIGPNLPFPPISSPPPWLRFRGLGVEVGSYAGTPRNPPPPPPCPLFGWWELVSFSGS